ncbi:MAG: A/G-specific adenine glycosylase [Chloroflexi bacterium]|nr:A/G-specific adenine glycosylase [Chloroflexota bacterium]
MARPAPERGSPAAVNSPAAIPATHSQRPRWVDAPRRAAVWAALRAWYAQARRDLPWRRTHDPYAIVIAELMLQQTQVERVVPKYLAFLERFATWRSLAAAPRAEVVRAWAGLGYNRRAVWLHQLAQVVVDHYEGALPADPAVLAGLPGLGPYTVAAVACFAHGQHVPLVDTNVRRVLGRLFAGLGPLAQREAWALAAWALPPDGAGDWHQALMDLGATICLARRPACAACAVATWCVARPALDGAIWPAGLPRPQRRVAEARETGGYPGSRRYFRGRIVDALRALPPGATLHLAALGSLIKPDYTPAEAPWLRELLVGLVTDGLVEWADGNERCAVRLAEGG